MSASNKFDNLDDTNKSAATSTAVTTKEDAGSVKKAAKPDGKSSMPGAVFNLANAVSRDTRAESECNFYCVSFILFFGKYRSLLQHTLFK